jgi:hypothetical protein
VSTSPDSSVAPPLDVISLLTAVHSDWDGQATLSSCIFPGRDTCSALHAEAPPVGSTEVRTSSEPTATHKRFGGTRDPAQRSPFERGLYQRPSWRSARRILRKAMSPLLSMATHSDTDGHETPAKPVDSVPSTCASVHAPPPPAGSVEVSTSPFSLTATHSDTDGPDTPARRRPTPSTTPGRLISAAVHCEPPPIGSDEVTTCPASSTATHSEIDGHETRSVD